MLADVLHHAVRHQIPDRLVVFGAAAYIGRRDGQGRDLKRIDLSFGQGHAVRTGVAGARDGHEVGEVPHEVGVLPLHNFGHGVCAGDEEQLGVGMLGADIAQGVDGVGDARTVDVDTRDGEFGVDAVAITVIRYRSSALVTCLSSLNTGRPVGTKITSSRSYTQATSEAATKWPL